MYGLGFMVVVQALGLRLQFSGASGAPDSNFCSSGLWWELVARGWEGVVPIREGGCLTGVFESFIICSYEIEW